MIIFYGATWCPDCRRSEAFFNKHDIDFKKIDISSDPQAAQEVEKLNNGMRSIPTIILDDGKKLVEPSNQELAQALGMDPSL